MDDNILNFKKFERTRVRLVNRITVTASNSFGFPTKFFQDNKIGDFKYVVLFYDENNKAVAFLFTNNEEEAHKFTLIKSTQGYGGSIVATSFFKSYNLDSQKYRGKYEWGKQTLDGVGEVFVIRLVEKQNEGTIPVI